MCKKVLTVLLVGALFLISSCVDKRYDLVNKEIATDVKIEGNTIALPIGDLKPIVLDDLIDLDSIEILDKNENGVYSIRMDSTISIKQGIDPIKLNIDPIQHKVDVDFEKVNISDVHIGAVNVNPAKFETPKISLAELNNGLPELDDSVRIDFESHGFAELLANINKLPDYMKNIPFDQEVSTGERTVLCNIEYTLPKQIETIYGIKLGSKDEKGVLVSVEVKNPGVLQGIDKRLNFEIKFPEIFRLAKNDKADQVGKYQIENGNALKVENFEANGDVSKFSFYITDIVNIDKNIHDGKLNYSEPVKYKIVYATSGTLELKEEMTVKDFAFNVNLKSDLSFRDVSGKTKDIKVDFNPIDMKFGADFNNLQHIDTINYVEFDETVSRIKFKTDMGEDFETDMGEDWLRVFKLKDDYALKISFPEELIICPEHSTYEGKDSEIVYNEKEHAFYIYDLSILAKTDWDLALQKLILNIPVKDGKCHMDVDAHIQFVDPKKNNIDYLVLAGAEMESLVDVLDKLNGEKEALFTMSESDLKVKDAVVHTKVIKSDLRPKNNPKFNLNEKVPNEIERIESIGFKKDVEMTFDLEVKGLETLDTDIDIVANVALPSFLKLETIGKSSGVSVDNGNLSIDTSYNPSSGPFRVKLLCTGIDFRNEEFNFKGLVPKDSTDGNSYISYDKDIVVEGEASIHGTEFHSTVLENDIAFNINFKVEEEIVVKTFHGVYNAKIDGVNENIALDFGEGLDFLREEGNSITLADPQMELVLTNPIGIPIDVNFEISGRDKTGTLVGNEIKQTLTIHPAKYDKVNDSISPVETKIFLTTDENNQKEGYDNYKVESLADLLAEIPDSISFKIEPIIKTDVTHHVDISDSIRLNGTYSVLIPLAFKDLHICYHDTIAGLQSSLSETTDMLSNISLGLKMDICNTMPLGLKLTMIPLDADGNRINDIEIADLVIRAGSGGEIVDENGALSADAVPQTFEFAIKNDNGDISSLDKLAMTIEATSNSTTGSAGLEGKQGLKISNLVFEVSGDIEIK